KPITQRGSEIVLATDKGRLSLNLKSGQWKLCDVEGNVAFESLAGATGFQVTKAGVTLNLTDDESIFGLGETTGTYNKRGLIRELWNIDVLGHAKAIYPSLRSLYVSIPFVVSLRNVIPLGLFFY